MQLEARLGIRFPEHYREFLLTYNGGYFDPEPEFRPPVDGAPASVVACLYGIHSTEQSAELARPISLAQFSGNTPPQVVPIGHSPIHELFLLVTDATGDDYGDLILHNERHGSFFIAHTMEEFFALLREPAV
jgi:hypothetical protein